MGKGGQGAKGQNRKICIVEYSKSTSSSEYNLFSTKQLSIGYGQAADAGADGANRQGQQLPNNPRNIEQSPIVNSYKSFAMEHLTNTIRQSKLQMFLDELNNNSISI